MITAGEAATLSYQHRRIPTIHADDLATDLYLLRFDHLIRKGIREGRCSAEMYIQTDENHLPTYDRTLVANKVISKMEGAGYEIDTLSMFTLIARWSRFDNAETAGTGTTLVQVVSAAEHHPDIQTEAPHHVKKQCCTVS